MHREQTVLGCQLTREASKMALALPVWRPDEQDGPLSVDRLANGLLDTNPCIAMPERPANQAARWRQALTKALHGEATGVESPPASGPFLRDWERWGAS